jgi:hypothetical protein
MYKRLYPAPAGGDGAGLGIVLARMDRFFADRPFGILSVAPGDADDMGAFVEDAVDASSFMTPLEDDLARVLGWGG